MTVCEQLLTLRYELGLNQKQMAEKLKIPARTLGDYERGKEPMGTRLKWLQMKMEELQPTVPT